MDDLERSRGEAGQTVFPLTLALTLLASSAAWAAGPPPELAAAEQALAQAKASPMCPPPDLTEADMGLQWARDAAAKGDQGLARNLAVTAQQLVDEAVAKAQAAAAEDRERVGKLFAKAFESAQEADRAGAGKLASREVEAAQKLLGTAQTAANTCQFRQAEDFVGQATKAFIEAAKLANEREAERARAEAAARAEAERVKAAEGERLKPEAEQAEAERARAEAAARAAAERAKGELKEQPQPAGPPLPPGALPQLKQPSLTLKTPGVSPPSLVSPPPRKDLPPSLQPQKPVPEKAPPEARRPEGAGLTLLGVEVIPSRDGAQVLLTLDGTLEPVLHAPKPPSDILTVDLPGVKQIQGPAEINGYLPFIKSIRTVGDADRGNARLLIDLAHDIPVLVTVTMFDGDPANPRLVPTRIILTFLRDTSRPQ